MTANVLPVRNDAFKATLSRIDVFELSATNDEVIALMRLIATKGHESLSLAVVDFIEQRADGRHLSMRLLEPSFKKVEYARSEGMDWEPLVLSQLQTIGKRSVASSAVASKETEVMLLRQAMERSPRCVADQQAFWCKATGKSRASFFRLLANHRRK
jgi:hypothetical protein